MGPDRSSYLNPHGLLHSRTQEENDGYMLIHEFRSRGIAPVSDSIDSDANQRTVLKLKPSARKVYSPQSSMRLSRGTAILQEHWMPLQYSETERG